MLGVSGILGNSGGDAPQPHESPAATTSGGEVGVAGSSTAGLSEEKLRIEEGDRNSGGNRWPRQETLALLKIRSDMDVAFRDSSLKGPLWEQVSRKLADLGFHRSAKKCKEKFENVYKYHKRTKEGRSTKPDGKTYRFFDQLEALESQPPLSLLPPPPRSQAHQAAQSPNPVAVAMPMSMAMPASANLPIVSQVTVPSTANPISVSLNINPTNPFPSNPFPPPPPPQPVPATTTTIPNPINLSQSTPIPSSHPNMSSSFASISSSSSTSSDEEPERRGKRKRKWESFFQRLMQEVIEKQEEMQKQFLETLERRERDRLAREEAWKVQEMARMNREHDLLVQERSIAAAKEAAVIAFLQKVSEQQIPNVPQIQMQMQVHTQENPIPPAAAAVQQPPPQPQPQQPAAVQPPPPIVQPTPQPPLQLQPPIQSSAKSLVNPKTDNGGENLASPSSSRWPKAEVEALISLRTNLDLKYQENGPKGPLWEEISNAMCKIGYNRNPKRCKEKWENINKYFKKVKESNKKRPEDSKTCPYFHQLDALYKEKAKIDNSTNCFNPGGGFAGIKPENPMVPIMVQPEQQWPLQQEQQHRPEEDRDSENIDQNNDDDDDGDEDDDEDEASGYEIVTNKPSSVGMVE
ncbi:Trihelix transcription factor GT-2 [Camellia lanceoleosa]|uniref:Trihelix transcription factor GT-2 n=1 Tax=Camellia lanceoleosa TaxID=1840588 RepID=A0ACC0HRC7_9ERIC|nr:Trihelix transcription factor GT-2 [Camellia lanceoleosa]